MGTDCNNNGILDECEPDCNNNGEPDDCDIATVGQLRFHAISSTPVVGGGATSVVAADFDRNGFTDLASANRTATSVSVVFNLGLNASNIWLGWDCAVDVYNNIGGPSAVPWSLAVNDFDGDDFPDLAAASGNDDFPVRLNSDLHIGVNGAGGGVLPPGVFDFHAERLNITIDRAEAMVVGDFDRDGDEDVAVADTDGVHVVVALNSGPMRLYPVGPDPIALAAGHFTSDVDLDIVSVNGSISELVVLINDGTGAFTARPPILLAGEPSAVLAVDLDNDGLDDIIVALKDDDSIRVYYSNGDGTFATPVTFDLGTAIPASLVVGDFNRDGAPGVAVGHDPGGLVSVLLNTGFGSLEPAESFALNSATSLVAIDLDGGLDDDLAGVTGAGSTIWVALNNTIYDCNRNGRPDSCDIEVGSPDVNGDGIPDECDRSCDLDGDCDCDDWPVMSGRLFGPDEVCGGRVSIVPHPTDLDGGRDTDLYDVTLFLRGITGDLSCCAPGGKGCIDPVVSSCVCDTLPSCCSDAWTVECVEAVEFLLCATCDGPPPCGDGLCDATEDCVNCPRDCGPCDGLCCSANGTPGCSNPSTQACVCDVIAGCCDDTWDQTCADVAASTCLACCGNGACDASETCTNCPGDCGVCDPFCGNDLCEPGENYDNCSLDCRECFGNCCLANATLGCEDRTVMDCVCALNPECCEGRWASTCAALSDDCGVCNEPCCTAHGTPGCDDESIEACVCAQDPFCCDTAWDEICVSEIVGLQCGLCGEPPVVIISEPPADTSTSDLSFVYDGFDENLGLWFKDVTLVGAAIDMEDGELPGASLLWRTDRGDIQPGGVTLLGKGTSINVRLYSNVCTGVWHEITLTATDSNGNSVGTVRRIFIWTIC